MLISQRQDDVAAIIVEIGTHRQITTEIATVATLGNLVGDACLDAGKVLAGDEVDDTRHRIGTVRGRRAARQRVNALHQRERDVVKVDATYIAGGNDARTIEQNDVAEIAQAAKIGIGRAAIAIVHVRANACHRTGNRTEHILSRIGLPQRKFIGAYHRNGRRRRQIGVTDQRAGDDDVRASALSFHRRRLRRTRIGRRGRLRLGKCRCCQQCCCGEQGRPEQGRACHRLHKSPYFRYMTCRSRFV